MTKYVYCHVNCAFENFKNARTSTNIIKDIQEVDGLTALKPNDFERLNVLISKSNQGSDNRPNDSVPPDNRKVVKQITPISRKKKLAVRSEPATKIMFANVDQLTRVDNFSTI